MSMILRSALVTLLLASGCFAQTGPEPSGRTKAFSSLPDWSGVWGWDVFSDQTEGQQLGSVGLRASEALATARPAFTAEWQKKYEEGKQQAAAAEKAETPEPSAGEQVFHCSVPHSLPMVGPGVFEILVTPEKVAFIHSIYGAEIVYADLEHTPKDEIWETYMGDSAGHWEGDTLVFETIAVRKLVYHVWEAPVPRGATQPPYTPVPASDKARYEVRIRLVKPDELQMRVTTIDPVALVKPWEQTFAFKRFTELDRLVYQDCIPENDRNPMVNGRFTTVVPR